MEPRVGAGRQTWENGILTEGKAENQPALHALPLKLQGLLVSGESRMVCVCMCVCLCQE